MSQDPNAYRGSNPNGYQGNAYQGPNAYPGQGPEYRQEINDVAGSDLLDRVKALIHEGNVRRIIVKQEGHTIVEIPLTVGVVGAIVAPALAAIGAIGALIAHCSIEVVRSDQP